MQMAMGKETAERLKRNTANHGGVAGPAFIERLINKYPTNAGLREIVQSLLRQSIIDLTPDGATAAQARAIKRFALAQTAGLLAVQLGVLPYTEARVKEAIGRMLQGTLSTLAELPDSERGITAVRDFILANVQSRFVRVSNYSTDDQEKTLRDIAGYISDDLYCLTTAAFKEACGGANPRGVASLLRTRGLLKPRDSDHSTNHVTVYGKKIVVYAIKAELIGNTDDGSQ